MRDLLYAAKVPLLIGALFDGVAAELYNLLVVLPELIKVHARLNALVDMAYGRSFSFVSGHVVNLFRLYVERSVNV